MPDTAATLTHLNRSAPSVSYPVGRSFACRMLLVCATILAVAMQVALLMGWGLPATAGQGAWWASGLLWLICLAWAWRSWLHLAEGWLSWAPDVVGPSGPSEAWGQAVSVQTGWWWSDEQGTVGQPVARVQPAMVFNHWMLLRVKLASEPGRAVWMWLEASALPARWVAWQRAVLAHGR